MWWLMSHADKAEFLAFALDRPTPAAGSKSRIVAKQRRSSAALERDPPVKLASLSS